MDTGTVLKSDLPRLPASFVRVITKQQPVKKKEKKQHHKCVNYERSNSKFKTERNSLHATNAEDVCEAYKSRKAYLISRTSYPPGALILE